MKSYQTGEIDVVVQTYDIADPVIWVETTSGVRQENRLYAQNPADAHGEGDAVHAVTFVEAGVCMSILLGGLLRIDIATYCALPTKSTTGTWRWPMVLKINFPS